MTSRDHLRAAARCWERAGFFEDAAERFTTAEAWRDAGRCFSQAERHADAGLAYSRAAEPLLEAREYLMGNRPERARPLYERLRSGPFVSSAAQVEVLLGLGEVETAARVALTSGNREAAAIFARFVSTRGRPDLAALLWWQENKPFLQSLIPWNRSLRLELWPQATKEVKFWPTIEFSEVLLVPIWEEETGDYSWGSNALAWSADSTIFAAALNTNGLARGRVGPDNVQLERWPVSTRCISFLPASHTVLTGSNSGRVQLVDEDGSTQPPEILCLPNGINSITFAAQGDRVAVTASNGGAQVKIFTWQEGRANFQIDEHSEPVEHCAPLTTWSPNTRRLVWSPGSFVQPNRLFFLSAEEGKVESESHGITIVSLAFTADGRFLISASWDGTVVVRDGQNGRGLARAESFAGLVHCATTHPQAALIAVGAGNYLQLLRLHPGEPPLLSRLANQSFDGGAQSLAFSPDGQHLLVLTGERDPPSGHLHLFRVDLRP